MRILISSSHRYPSFREIGSGRHPKRLTSGSGQHMQDLLARGLAELGHEVFYLLKNGSDASLPEGVRLVSDPVADVDIYQTTSSHHAGAGADILEFVTSRGLPHILSCHLDRSELGEASSAGDNWIFVARSLARTYGRDRYVLNGIDPADYCFSRTKADFLLFMATAEHMITKGLLTAIAVSQRTGTRLVVAGTGRSRGAIDRIASMCRGAGADYIGDIRGAAKAEQLAAARALILPSQANEGCPLSLIEALMSGTPVVAAPIGGIPEIVSPDTGFLCDDEDAYVRAIERLDEISPDRCRDHAIEHFHYLRMARDYAREFEAEIAGPSGLRPGEHAARAGRNA